MTKKFHITSAGHNEPRRSLLSVHCPFTFRVQNPNNWNDLSRKKAPVIGLAAKQGLFSRGKNAEFLQGRGVPTWKPTSSLLQFGSWLLCSVLLEAGCEFSASKRRGLVRRVCSGRSITA